MIARHFRGSSALPLGFDPTCHALSQQARLFWDKRVDDGITFYHSHSGSYTVILNPSLPRGRLHWTMAHELGHILLGHFTDYNTNRLTAHEEKILDREADEFTKEFLMPAATVIGAVRRPLTVAKIGRVKNLFQVSWEATGNRLIELALIHPLELHRLYHHHQKQLHRE
ncbi:conserved hypothetical protein [Heliomicrobium modesticaldum Ice1]|uniref:IrrE N-terminal-like domain-containing protein n=1 Tax=Heliobacterium modesticaldum (strain ATCC 51547 / Ice1) TaxID=498761 RepID=B0TGX3_HELMI|nr:ImmA/IrrE family metallo-endopeptidase [Heliomicrobium modesticaldum]ABZ83298.1 conserved hypothetical protein [Heliomicrobium modesticaldum Ice1]